MKNEPHSTPYRGAAELAAPRVTTYSVSGSNTLKRQIMSGSGKHSCAKCGAELTAFAMEGLCSACLLERGLEAEASLPVLSRFGDYELIEEIARGGMGVVYKARQLSLERTVALKMIRSGSLASESEIQRFRSEACAAATLQHSGIVAIHEVGEHEGQLYYSMDYIEGGNLAQLVRNGPLTAARAAQLVKTIAEAIHHAHGRGILHRDLKPSNVLLDSQGHPRVTDFGLAKRLTTDADLTLTGQVLGSPNFMPPEQAAGKHRELTPAADVYSLGALLYHLVTGRAPFIADNIPATLRLVSETEPVAPRLLAPNVPRDLETICLKCLHKEPRRRYETAQALVDELHRFLQDAPILARPVSRPEKVWRWCRRKPVLAGLAASTALLLLVVAIGSPIASVAVFVLLGGTGVLWQWRRAEVARKTAETNEHMAKAEARKSLEAAQFLKEMLKSVGPSVALGRDTTMMREILDKMSGRFDHDLQQYPEVEADLRLTIAQTYHDLGLYGPMEQMANDALRLSRTRFGPDGEMLAQSLTQLGHAQKHLGAFEKAEASLREAVAIGKRRLGKRDPNFIESLNQLGQVLYEKGQLDEAEVTHREALAISRHLFGNVNASVAQALENLAIVMSAAGSVTDAQAMNEEVLDIRRKLFGPAHPAVALSLNNLAAVVEKRVGFAEAEGIYRQALNIYRKLNLDDEHPDLTESLINLSLALAEQGKFDEGESLLCHWNDRVQLSKSADHKAKRAALHHLVHFYESCHACSPSQKRAGAISLWKQKLAEFDQLIMNRRHH